MVSSTVAIAVTLFLAPGLIAQEQKPKKEKVQEEKAQEGMSLNARVARCLKTLSEVGSYRFAVTTKGSAGPFQIRVAGGGAKATQKETIEGTKEGSLLCWTANDGEDVIATKNGIWVALDRDGDWIPGRRPIGGGWKSKFLPDPSFLADRLHHLLKWSKWDFKGPEELNEKPVRVYRVMLEDDEANHLVRTSALPEANSFMSGIGRVVMIAGGPGGRAAIPEPERKIEVLLYEDPATHLPLKITANIFSKDNMLGGRGIVLGGFGVEEEEEEEEEGKKKKKPSRVVEIELSEIGKARAKDLGKEARKMLQSQKGL